MTEPRLQSNMGFCLMSLAFWLRDMVRPPAKILAEAKLRPGMTVLDFGCGPGGFSLAAARSVGPEGRVYAVDVHPLAVRSVQRAAAKQGLDNVRTIRGNNVAELGVVINRAGLNGTDIRSYCTARRVPILQEIPDDRKLAEAYSRGLIVCEALPEYQAMFAGLLKSVRATEGGTG